MCTRMVCEALAKTLDFRALNPCQQQGLALVTLFHDTGKLRCTREEDGILVYPGHGAAGAQHVWPSWHGQGYMDCEKSFRASCGMHGRYTAAYGHNAGNQGQVVQATREQERVYLRAKQPFAWNATGITAVLRGKQIRLFEEYHASVRVIYFETP